MSNTLEQSDNFDAYEESRRYAENQTSQAQSMEEMLLELQELTGETPVTSAAPEPSAPEAPAPAPSETPAPAPEPAQSNTTLATEGADEIQPAPPQPSGILPPETSDSALAKALQAKDEANKEKGVLDHALDTVDFLASPLMALGDAGLAPIARPSQAEHPIEATIENLGTAWDAFTDRLFPEFGVNKPNYGREIADNLVTSGILPEDTPPWVKDAVGVSLEVLTDPTVVVGLPFAKTAARGLDRARDLRNVKDATDTEQSIGIIEEGIHELFGAGRIASEKFNELQALAKEVDQGNRQSAKELNDALNEDPEVQAIIATEEGLDEATTAAVVSGKTGKVGFVPYEKVEVDVEEESLIQTLYDKDHQAAYIDFNLNIINNEHSFTRAIASATTYYRGHYKKATDGMSKEELAETATEQNQLLTDITHRINKPMTGAEAYAARQILADSAELVKDAAMDTKLATDTPLDKLAYARAKTFHNAIVEAIATGGTENVQRLELLAAKQASDEVKAVDDLVESIIPTEDSTVLPKEQKGTKKKESEAVETMKGIKAAADNVVESTSDKAIKEMVKEAQTADEVTHLLSPGGKKTDDVVFEIYSNAILSGPITHSVNIVSNTANIAWSPTEKMLEGVSAAARGDWQKAMRDGKEAAGQVAGIARGIGDTFRLLYRRVGGESAEQAWVDLGLPADLAKYHEIEQHRRVKAISSENLNARGMTGHVIDFMGRIIRIPGAMLYAEDLGFKAIHYRMQVSGQAYRKAMDVQGDAAAKRLARNKLSVNPDDNMIRVASDKARYFTFTNELGVQGQAARNFILKYPGLRYLIPFFNTPTNIVKMGVRNSFVGSMYKDVVQTGDLAALTAKGDVARAKLAMGTAAPMAMMAYWGDHITGHIDESTPEGRHRAQNTPPYSIRVGDEWYSYEKIEPMRTIMGLMATYNKAINNIDYVNPQTGNPTEVGDELTSALIAPFLAAVGDTYMLQEMAGIMGILEAASTGNPDNFTKKFKQMAAAAAVPNVFRQVNRELFDDQARIVEGFMGEVMRGIPGLSQTLPPRYTLWGDEQYYDHGFGPDIVSPIKTSAVSMDKYDRELLRLEEEVGLSIPGTPRQFQWEGVTIDLGPEHRSQFSLIRGKGVDGKTPLKDSFKEMMEDPAYLAASDIDKAEIITEMLNQAFDLTRDYMMASNEDLMEQHRTTVLNTEIQRRKTQNKRKRL